MDFVDINEENGLLVDHPSALPNIKLDSVIIDGTIDKEEVENINADFNVINIDNLHSVKIEEPEEDQICIKESCDVSQFYGCPSGTNGFQKDNLFSELTDEYQRTIARMNLGIAEKYAIKWGNITGNLLNQKDLYKFVTDSIVQDLNKVIDEINLKLAQWAFEINVRLENKAPIDSPQFTGNPTVPLPDFEDSSDTIASTAWVKSKITELLPGNNVSKFQITPEYALIEQVPASVTITWDYYTPVTKQYINNVLLENDVRTYTLTNITESISIILQYEDSSGGGVKIQTFEIKNPIYYGNSISIRGNKTTGEQTFEADASSDQYIYIFYPSKQIEISVNGIIGGFQLIGTQYLQNVLYYAYKSVNSNLGKTRIRTIEI